MRLPFGLARRAALLAGLLGLSTATALTLDDVAFAIGFDQGLKADLARGNGQPLEVLGKPALVPGRQGQALKLRSGQDALVFDLKDNLDPRQGAICFWLSPGNWDAANGDALQVLLHTDGKEQQLAVQTLWPWGELFMPLWQQGQLAGGFPAGRSCRAPMKQAQDLESLLKPGTWYHYVFTWRDGYTAAYLNGKRMGEARIGEIALRQLGERLVLGWDKRQGRIFWDPGCDEKAAPLAAKPWESLLDELVVWRSFVFDADVAKIYQYGAVEYARRAEPSVLALETAFYQSASLLEAQVISPGRSAQQATLEVVDATNKAVARQAVAVSAEQGQARVELDLATLPLGSYRVRATLAAGFATPWQEFEKVRPEWLGNRLGAADVVLPPYTPLAAEAKDGRVTVEVWGRSYVFAGPFPSAIQSQGQALLAAPVQAVFGGRALAWSAPVIREQSPTRVVLASEAPCAGYTVSASTRIEYDGMVWCELAFRGQPQPLADWRLELPFERARCQFLAYPTRRDCWFPKEKDWSSEWRPYIFVGDDERGLQWFAESDQWWSGQDARQAITLAPTPQAQVLRLNVIREAVAMPAAFDLKFGFMAAPLRPRPAGWRGWGNSTPYRLGLPESYKRRRLDYSWWSVSPGWLVPNQLTPAGQEYNRGPGDWLPFTSSTFRGVRAYADPDLYAQFDTWRQFGAEWRLLPEQLNLGKPKSWNQTMINPAPSFIDRFAWETDQFFRSSSAAGLYFDGYAGIQPSANRRAGFGYVGRDGIVKPTYPILAGRELMRRVYALRLQYRPDGALMIHPATSHFLPCLAFSDCIYDGEFMGWSDIKTTMETKGVLAGFTEDKARFLLNFRAYGLVPLIDTRWAVRLAMQKQGTDSETDALMRLIYGQFLLADVHGVDFGAWSRVLAQTTDWWGLAAPDVQFLGYWENRPPASAGPGTRTSAWLKPGSGKVLLATLNANGYGRSPQRLAKEGKFGYELKLDLARLGLTAGRFRACDAESLGTLAIPVNGDTLSLAMQPWELRLIALEPLP